MGYQENSEEVENTQNVTCGAPLFFLAHLPLLLEMTPLRFCYYRIPCLILLNKTTYIINRLKSYRYHMLLKPKKTIRPMGFPWHCPVSILMPKRAHPFALLNWTIQIKLMSFWSNSNFICIFQLQSTWAVALEVKYFFKEILQKSSKSGMTGRTWDAIISIVSR